MKQRYILFLLLAVTTAVTSCVYDYNPQLDGEGGYVIVEGDIVIGDESRISLSYSWSLVDSLAAQDEKRMAILYGSKMHIEDSQGGRYDNTYSFNWGSLDYPYSSPVGVFDMRNADPSLQYRLVIENSNGTYASAWAGTMEAGQIDSVSYRISPDKSTMAILVSTHSPGEGGAYYRWSVNETWEYHAEVNALYDYRLTGPGTGEVFARTEDQRTYRCWTTGNRPEIMTATTEGLVEDRLVNFQLYTLECHDERMSVMYAPEVVQMRIPEDAYRYWQVMDRNSHDVGGLFSAEPSELRGNVVNLDHPEELVLGYVGVMSVTRKKIFINSGFINFYRRTIQPQRLLDTLSNDSEYYMAYRLGKRPAIDIYSDDGDWQGYEWWPQSCVDCRWRGGTTTVPEDWPLRY